MTQDRIPLDAGSSRPAMGPEELDAAMQAGYAHVESVIGQADGFNGHAPFWHGWALREAFVAGATWAGQTALPSAPAVEGVEPVKGLFDNGQPLCPASAISRLVKERDEAQDALYEAQRQPWPEWANEIRECLEGYGVDPGDEWNVAEQFEEWLAGCVENETRRAEAAEASVARLTALLAEARADPTTEQVERALVAWHDILSIKNRPRSEFWRMFAAISAARRYQQKREAK